MKEYYMASSDEMEIEIERRYEMRWDLIIFRA